MATDGTAPRLDDCTTLVSLQVHHMMVADQFVLQEHPDTARLLSDVDNDVDLDAYARSMRKARAGAAIDDGIIKREPKTDKPDDKPDIVKDDDDNDNDDIGKDDNDDDGGQQGDNNDDDGGQIADSLVIQRPQTGTRDFSLKPIDLIIAGIQPLPYCNWACTNHLRVGAIVYHFWTCPSPVPLMEELAQYLPVVPPISLRAMLSGTRAPSSVELSVIPETSATRSRVSSERIPAYRESLGACR